MGAADGHFAFHDKFIDHGPDAERWNLVLVGEGYTVREAADFVTYADKFKTALFNTPPFDTVRAAINIHRLDTVSAGSGAADPIACGGLGSTPATFFDARFCSRGAAGGQRWLTVDHFRVIDLVTNQVPRWNAILVVVNSPIYGGSCRGQVGTTSVATGTIDIGIHEIGHALGLQDEYGGTAGKYSGNEPAVVNLTKRKQRAGLKWAGEVLASTPIPTWQNPACNTNVQNLAPPAGVVGTFEGAYSTPCGIYRPTLTCKMRELASPFCVVCKKHIAKTLGHFMPS